MRLFLYKITLVGNFGRSSIVTTGKIKIVKKSSANGFPGANYEKYPLIIPCNKGTGRFFGRWWNQWRYFLRRFQKYT